MYVQRLHFPGLSHTLESRHVPFFSLAWGKYQTNKETGIILYWPAGRLFPEVKADFRLRKMPADRAGLPVLISKALECRASMSEMGTCYVNGGEGSKALANGTPSLSHRRQAPLRASHAISPNSFICHSIVARSYDC